MNESIVLTLLLVAVAACGDDAAANPDAKASVDASQVEDAAPSVPDASPPWCVTSAGPFPRSLDLPNREPNGVFDPNIARDPDSGRLWMAHSGVTGPPGSGAVSTHLSYSDDQGATWCHAGIVNPATEVPQNEQPPAIAQPVGGWYHETSAIVFDPGAPAESRWRLIWMRYLHVEDNVPGNEDRHLEHGWIGQRTAATAEGLLTAPEGKLFSAGAYYASAAIESYNDAVLGPPEKRWDSDPTLGDCLAFAEPGMLAQNGKLYVAMFCARSTSDTAIVLVSLDHATQQWSHVATLLTPADARNINSNLTGFNAADLVFVGGAARLLVTPIAGTQYLGCIEYSVDLTAGTVSGPLSSLPIAPGITFSGACTYQEGSVLGLIVSELFPTVPEFRLKATGTQL